VLSGLRGAFERPHDTKNDMGTPQDPRTRRRQRLRRAKKNLEWEAARARENAEAAKPKTPAKKAT
jgi:hypothetical protein